MTRLSGCACCGFNRRKLLAAGCAGCVGAAALGSVAARPAVAANKEKLRIRIVFSLLEGNKTPGPDWPHVGFNFEPLMERFTNLLKNSCGDCEFVTATAAGAEQAKKIVDADKNAGIDGYIVFQLNCWNAVVQSVVATGKPTLYVDFQYGGSGGFLVYTAGFLRAKAPNLAFVASSKAEDLVAAARCFSKLRSGTAADFVAAVAAARKSATPAADSAACKSDDLKTLDTKELLAKLKQSKILAVGGGWPGIAPQIRKEMGMEVVNVPFAELNDAWKAADVDQSKEIVARWRKTAAEIQGIAQDTLEKCAAMYLGMKAVLKQRGAEAITVNCLGGFYGGHIHAYPCLGFHELLNEGLVGACECDVRSTATMVAITAMTGGRPGYISDPIIDTASRQIIYAHCVASCKAFGPQGPSNPFTILTHSEDRKGASVRSTLPIGYMTTSVELAPERKIILMHRGKAVANVVDDRACRTKLAADPVGDIEKLFAEWDQWGWHRVTYYGDLKEPIYALADALGWKVLEEA